MRRGSDADPTWLEWLRDLLLAAACLAVLLAAAMALAGALALLVLRAADTVG